MVNKKQIAAKAKKPIITQGRNNKKRRLDKREKLIYINYG